MKKRATFLLVFILIFIFSTFAFSKKRCNWREIIFGSQKTLKLDRPVFLEISHLSPVSNIVLKPSPIDSEIVVKLDGKMKCCCNIKEIDIRLEKKANKVAIKIEKILEKSHRNEIAYKGDVSLVVQLPEEMIRGIFISSSFEDIDISNFLNLNLKKLIIKSDSGEISFNKKATGNIDSQLVDIKSNSGDINLSSLKGNELKVKCSSGEVKIENVDIDSCSVRLYSGDLNIKNSTLKSTVAETDSGNIHVSGVNSSILKLSSSSGDIYVSDAISDNIGVSSDSGDIALSIHSAIKKLDVSTSSGDINVGIPRGDYHMLVKTDSGDLKIKMRLNNVIIGENSFEAGFKGQPEVKLSSDSGNITMHWIKE